MERLRKISELKSNIIELRSLLEDFVNLYESKNRKINNLENELIKLKSQISQYIDELDNLIEK
tara:strand:- start:4982 stop:5170 length:189 start_codon:yes stop_codon:yes gene_type:complete